MDKPPLLPLTYIMGIFRKIQRLARYANVKKHDSNKWLCYLILYRFYCILLSNDTIKIFFR